MLHSRWLLPALLFLVPSLTPAQGEWGKLQGRIVWPNDNLPKPVVIPAGVGGCPANIPGEKWVVEPKNKGVRWVLVWIEPVAPGAKLPLNPALKMAPRVTMDQPGCTFEPHVLGMQEGQTLEAKNPAKFPHNFNYFGKPTINPGDNLLVPAGGSLEIKGLKAQELPLTVRCNIHPWMNAMVGVFSHPYFAVTDADGRFVVDGAPAGAWRLKIWQEEIGFSPPGTGRKVGTPVTVKQGTPTDLGDIPLAGAK